MKMEQTQCSETLAYKIQTLEKKAYNVHRNETANGVLLT